MRLILCAIYVYMGGVIFATPNMTRRELLFAIPVPPGFRDGPAGRRAILLFRAIVAAVVLAGTSALLLSPNQFLDTTATVVPIALVFAGGLGFYWQNRRLAPFTVQFAQQREVELTTLPEKLPHFTWLAIGPFLILTAAATWLFIKNGQPNGWTERTTREVYGPLLSGTALSAWMLIMALAIWFGSRRLRSRSVMLGSLIAVQYFFGVIFALIPLQPVLGIPVWVIALSPIAFFVPLLVIMTNKMSEPSETMDSTPNECWKASIFYYNPNDAALMVEKRVGLGYSFNFANRWSWVLLIGLVLTIASIFLW
jgi:uncharacterized membrane protein